MIYSHQEDNKFEHLLLDGKIPYKGHYAKDRAYKLYKKERMDWIREHIGKHNIDWTVNYGFIRKGKKVYQKDAMIYARKNRSKFWKETDFVVQWSFLEKDLAMAFRLMWS